MTADGTRAMKERTATAVTTVAERKHVGEQHEVPTRLSEPHATILNATTFKATKVLVSESLVAPLISKFEDLTKSQQSSQLSPVDTVMKIDWYANRNGSPKRSVSTSQLSEIGGLGQKEAAADKDHSRRNIVDRSNKPALHPKPDSLLLRLSTEKISKIEHQSVIAGPENRDSMIAHRDSRTVTSDSEKLYHAPKINPKNVDQNLSLLKDKRLSIAKDFSNLESVLNNDTQDLKSVRAETEPDVEEMDDDDEEGSGISITTLQNKISNSSFLHKQRSENNASKWTADEEPQPNECDPLSGKITAERERETLPSKTVKNSSALHDIVLKKLNDLPVREPTAGGPQPDSAYPWRMTSVGGRVANDSGDSAVATSDHYQYLDDDVDSEDSDSANVYSDVIYAQLGNGDDIENYETISWERPCENSPTNSKNDFSLVSNDEARYSSSDSSLEQTNSLYYLKPPSNGSSTTTTMTKTSTISAFSFSNDYFHENLDALHLHTLDLRSAARNTTDEEDTDYCDTDNDCLTNRSIANKPKNFKKKRKLKFPIYRKEHPSINEDGENNDWIIDDFDDSSSDLESFEMNGRTEQPPVYHSGFNKTAVQSQNIYGLVEKVVRKSTSTVLNSIRKISVSNITTRNHDSSRTRSKAMPVGEINVENSQSTGNGGSVRWPSFKSRLKPKYSTVSSSTSIFYVPPEDLVFDKRQESGVTKRPNCSSKNRRRTTCIELRPTPRPTSPPPPPPVDKYKMNGANSVSSLSIYSDPSTRSSNSGSEINSEPHSSRSSDLHLRFADEPLYQFYAESIAQLNTGGSSNVPNDTDGYEEIASTASRPSAMELITPSPNGHGQHRSLWCEVPEVRDSGILATLSPDKKKLQEAIFEIITSEASYYKSLSVLDKIFANSSSFRNESILSKNDWKVLFGNVTEVKKCSEKLLAALEKCWQDSILLTGLCHVVYEHAKDHFQIYVKYCSNQIYIDRTLKKLREQNPRFVEIIHHLEANPACQSLNLPSFLMLPMQRITRMPLLMDAVLSKMDPIIDGDEYETYQITLATLNKIVRDCNEAARKLERYEEMLLLSQQLEFTRKDVKMYTIASSSRWLIRSGPMEHIPPDSSKLTLTKKLTKQTSKLYFFLFNDILIVAKKKTDAPTYVVLDYCARNVVQMSLLDDSGEVLPALNSSNYRYLLMLTILDNHEGKTVVMILNCDSDSTRQRWLETTSSHLTSDNPDEKLYEKWDCPQVSAVHSYTAVQPDELSLHAGDVVKVLKKTTDGWYHGERIRDGMTGWFPGNYTVEIASQHTRAKNLKLRHRLLTLSASYLQHQQQKKT